MSELTNIWESEFPLMMSSPVLTNQWADVTGKTMKQREKQTSDLKMKGRKRYLFNLTIEKKRSEFNSVKREQKMGKK